MRSVVRTMRLKPTAKNTVGGTTSRSSLIKNARRRDLGMNGFLSARGRMSGAQLELTNSTPKILRYFHGRQLIFSKGLMGWANCHLHQFIIHLKEYGIA